MKRPGTYRILAVDDDPGLQTVLSTWFDAPQRQVVQARSAADLRAQFDGPRPDMVLLDWKLPDGDGLQLLPDVRSRWPAAHVVMISGYASSDVVVEAIKRGADAFQTKPLRLDELDCAIRAACPPLQPPAPVALPADDPARFLLATRSPAMRKVVALAQRVAASDIAVLLTGATGTGKEVVANFIHARSPRAAGPMVKINCAAIPRDLIESELFGVVKGAYTGAHASRRGLLGEAAGGTLLLDEITELPLDVQSKLLRVLQYREYRPIGAAAAERADCRILAATNRPAREAIAKGCLRADLYYRVGAVTLPLPSLAERREDILPLAEVFVRRFRNENHQPAAQLSSEAAAALRAYSWPGNIRQLENEIQRAVLLAEGDTIGLTDLSPALQTTARDGLPNLPEIEADRLEAESVRQALAAAHGNKTAAARALGVTRQTLYNKLRQHGLDELPDEGGIWRDPRDASSSPTGEGGERFPTDFQE